MAELAVTDEAISLVMAMSVLPASAASMTFLDEEAMGFSGILYTQNIKTGMPRPGNGEGSGCMEIM